MRTYYLESQGFASAALLTRALTNAGAGMYRVRIVDSSNPRQTYKRYRILFGDNAQDIFFAYATTRIAAAREFVQGSSFIGIAKGRGAHFRTPGGADFYITQEGGGE